MGVRRLCWKPPVQKGPSRVHVHRLPAVSSSFRNPRETGRRCICLVLPLNAVTQGDHTAEEGQFLRVEFRLKHQEAMVEFEWRCFAPPGGLRGPGEDGHRWWS